MNTHYERYEHRSAQTPFSEVQQKNQRWWTEQKMSYDWQSSIDTPEYSVAWFDEVDRRFIHDSRLYGHNQRPFDRIIPFHSLSGKKVLEVGCGMGLHSELMIRAGANLTAIDLSPTSVHATQTRLQLKGLHADVRQQDAEDLPFADREFDFIWSWGVIHHSSRTAKIVRELARVSKPDASCRVMVYNREGASAWRSIVKYQWLGLGHLRGQTQDEALNRGTDGFHARHYTKDQFEDLFRAYYTDVNSIICGQVPDSLPLPRRLRGFFERRVSEEWLRAAQSRRGSFIFLTASNPS